MGAIAFWIAFVWSLIINFRGTIKEKLVEQVRLNYLLIAGTLFAWGNFAYTAFKYLTHEEDFGCSITPIEHPLESSCFIGAIIYLLALITGYLAKKYYLKIKAK